MISDYVDSHFHFIEMQKRNPNAVNDLQSAFQAGLSAALEIGTDHLHMKERCILKKNIPGIYLSFGFSPHWVTQPDWETTARTELAGWAQDERIHALGETGLDFYWNYGTSEEQQKLFLLHLQAALEFNLPVIIHSRNADKLLTSMLGEFRGKIRGVLHCFGSDKQAAEKILDLGLFISFAGNITYNNAQNLCDALQAVPLARLLVETDAPFLSPVPFRGTPNHPNLITNTYDFIAKQKKIAIQDLIDQVRDNFFTMLDKSPGVL
ncbi:MAG: TatD family hydrolase [Spirochaetales bacterium]|nr:TatD family hydrolase [Spirochaetales bacterium]